VHADHHHQEVVKQSQRWQAQLQAIQVARSSLRAMLSGHFGFLQNKYLSAC
jgi:chaperonin cofactor prefoldin